MATDIVMPRLSDSMEEGTVLKWLKSVGDEVAVGEELVEIETDKANMVYESDTAGTLIETIAGEGDTLPIGEVIARVGEAGEEPSGNGASSKDEQPKDEQRGRGQRVLPAQSPPHRRLPPPAGTPPRRHPLESPASAERQSDGRARQGLPDRSADC